jgi:hypothetical protein
MLIPVSLVNQFLPGMLEVAGQTLVEYHVDTQNFGSRYKNDEKDRPAYDPKMLQRRQEQLKRLEQQAACIEAFLATNTAKC